MNLDAAIVRVLELSAEAQAKRREAAENSSEFHKLMGAVLAYGEALDLLTKLRKEFERRQRSTKTPLAALAYLFLSSNSSCTKRVEKAQEGENDSSNSPQENRKQSSVPAWSHFGLCVVCISAVRDYPRGRHKLSIGECPSSERR
jgi:hypothetical protein